MTVLDIGTGTANLAIKFDGLGCALWCTDFSARMLEKARVKLPAAHYVLADMRAAWPAKLERRFDRIVSAYVFHHLELVDKIILIRRLVAQNLTPAGRLVIGDLSFANEAARERFKCSAGDAWEEEPFWIVEQALPALNQAGLYATYTPVSVCAGVYTIESNVNR
jgi:predicted TPR repeat methyltransferase